MNWINFLSYLGIAYVLYYSSVYMLDRMTTPRSGSSDPLPALTFSETAEPEQVRLEDFTESGSDTVPVSASVGLGGVSLKALFDLARKDAIQFTRSVSF